MRKCLLLVLCIVLLINFISAQNWKKIKQGGEFAIGLKENGAIYSWGFNGNGQLGLSLTDVTHITSEEQIGQLNDWSDVVAGGFHALALKSDGSLWGWGLNGFNQINDSGDVNIYAPVQVGTDTDWEQIEACQYSSYAIKNDGSLWVWGNNANGELGLGDKITRDVPTKLGDNGWKSISAGGFITMAIRDDNTLWRWGISISYSEEGGFVTGSDLVPVQVNTDTDWRAVSVGLESAVALKEDGTLWVYGVNTNNQLGVGNIVFSPEFINIGPDQTWEDICSGSFYCFAINSQRQLYGWGNNQYGQLGATTDNAIAVPTLIYDSNQVSYIDASKGVVLTNGIFGSSTFILSEESGTVCCGGANYVGQLGIGGETPEGTREFICTSTSSVEKEDVTNVSVFPNPADSYFIINNAENSTVNLYNSLGQLVHNENIKQNQQTVSTVNIPSGAYFLRIENGDSRTTKKLYISH